MAFSLILLLLVNMYAIKVLLQYLTAKSLSSSKFSWLPALLCGRSIESKAVKTYVFNPTCDCFSFSLLKKFEKFRLCESRLCYEIGKILDFFRYKARWCNI